MNPGKLLQKINEGDPSAFEKVYYAHVDEIYRFVKLRVNSKETAQDITSDIFFKAWRFIKEKGTPILNMRAFLFKIARNLIIDHIRKEKEPLLPLEENIFIVGKSTLEEKTDISLMNEHLKTALKKLSSSYQELIILRYIEELSLDEISHILGKNKNSLSVGINRALSALKQHLKHINFEL